MISLHMHEYSRPLLTNMSFNLPNDEAPPSQYPDICRSTVDLYWLIFHIASQRMMFFLDDILTYMHEYIRPLLTNISVIPSQLMYLRGNII